MLLLIIIINIIIINIIVIVLLFLFLLLSLFLNYYRCCYHCYINIFITIIIIFIHRLHDFNLSTLRARRAVLDLVMYYTIITVKTRLAPADLFTMNDRSSHRSNSLTLVMPICRTSANLHFFSVRLIHAWNT